MSSISSLQSSMYSSYSSISSGSSLSSASYDAAGLAISEQMKADITASSAAQKNVADASSLANVSESALNEISTMLNRVTEIATLATNGTYSDSQRAMMQSEIDSISDEINKIVESTNFNGMSLLNGSEFQFQVGTDNESSSTTALSISSLSDLAKSISQIDVSTVSGAMDALDIAEASNDFITNERSNIGAVQNRLDYTLRSLSTSEINAQAAQSRIADTDIAGEYINLTQKNVLMQANLAMTSLSQQNQMSVLNLLT